MQDLYSVRILLETEGVRQARPLDREEEAELTALLDDLKQASASDDVARVLELHRRYHFALYGLTDSSWQRYLINLLWEHTERYQRLSLPFRHYAADPEHRGVLEALAGGDNDMAASALRSHLETTAKLVIEAYQAPNGEAATS